MTAMRHSVQRRCGLSPNEARYNDDEDEDTDPRAYSKHNKDGVMLRQL